MASLLILFVLFTVSSASISVSTFDYVSTEQAACVRALGYCGLSAPVWRENCKYDPTGLANLMAFNAAGGFSRIDGIFIHSILNSCSHTENQMEAAVNKMRSLGIKIGTMWIHCTEPHVWTNDVADNRATLASLVKKATAMGQALPHPHSPSHSPIQDVGFFAEKEAFEFIFGSDFALYGTYPLWWSKMNHNVNFTGFESFGGWKTPAMHEYGYGSADSCGRLA